MKVIAIIPARYASTRFPGKPLVDIQGKPMIQHVFEKAVHSGLFEKVVVATDDDRIKNTVLAFGGEVEMTNPDHQSGTDRCGEVVNSLPDTYDVVINIQGDEPFINPKDINEVIKIVHNHPDKVATLRTDLIGNEGKDPNVVKAISNAIGLVGMFTRSSIYMRTNFAYKHIGIYGYSSEILNKISLLEPTESSIKDSLEQLTWMDNNIPIIASWTSYRSLGVDTRDDLLEANKIYLKND